MSETLQALRVDAAAIPTIDIAGLFGARLSDRQAVAQHMRAACEHNGFFYVANHGISGDLIDQVMAHTKTFFALPLAAKLSLDKRQSKANRGYEPLGGQTLESGAPPDLKEGFYIGPEVAADDPRAAKFNRGPNQWPPADAAFRTVMEAYRDQMTALAKRLLCGLALSLDLPENYFEAFSTDPIVTVRLLHYPPQPASAPPQQRGAGAHTDFGGVTLLLQDEVGGLQVWDQATRGFIHAPPVPGTFVVNLGDMIARWTNDRYRSTLHRVVNTSGRERYSIPFFFTGNSDHLVSCIPTCLGPGEQPKYPPITVEAHLRAMYQRTYVGA
jgi:isopenicillin N synthase-like dioxygenase